MHRIVVVGNSGSGKSTIARKLGEELEIPVLELDSIYHQKGWEPLPEEEFRAKLADFALNQEWVIDGNYNSEGMRELIWPVADTLVWLDLPRWMVMPRIIWRTLIAKNGKIKVPVLRKNLVSKWSIN
jgi:adenylate kinase family enzyme